MDEKTEQLHCWARMAVRALLVQVLLNASNEFALMAKVESRRRVRGA
jgi:hypothetical protein